MSLTDDSGITSSSNPWGRTQQRISDMPTPMTRVDTGLVTSGQRHQVIFVYMGEPKMVAPKKPFPEHFYVDVPTLSKTASLLVFLTCALSLVVSATSGFKFIHPYAAILFGLFSILFFIMGEVLQRRSKRS